MSETRVIDAMWDDSPVNVTTEVNFIWSIANKLRGTYHSDKYKDVIIPMTIIRRFECALAPTKKAVVEQAKKNPNYPAKAMYKVSGFQFYNTSEYDLAELVNDSEHLADNFKSYIQGFSSNIQEILLSSEKGLDFGKQIDKMDKNNRLLSVVKAFSELDLDPRTIDNVKMGYIFEELIRKFSENAEAGDHYTGRDISIISIITIVCISSLFYPILWVSLFISFFISLFFSLFVCRNRLLSNVEKNIEPKIKPRKQLQELH